MTEPYNSTEDVRAWNIAAGNVCPDKPTAQLTKEPFSDADHNAIFGRHREIMNEEINEWDVADGMQDMVGIFDALCDMQVVLDGIFAAYGMTGVKEAGVKEVMRANWSKFDEDGKPLRRHDGKILKGPNYTPPNLGSILEGNQ